MFCEKCGTNNDDGAKFCVGCGNVFETAAPAPEAFEDAPAPAPVAGGGDAVSKIKKFAIPGAILVVVVLALLALFGVFSSGAEKAAKKYLKAQYDGNAEVYCQYGLDPYREKDIIKSEYNDIEDKDDIIRQQRKSLEESTDSRKKAYGDNVKAKIKIKKVIGYSKEEIKALNKYLTKTQESVYDDDNILQDVKVVKALVTLKGSEDFNTFTTDLVACKIKGKWYIDSVPGLYDLSDVKEMIKEYE